ncbi:MAG: protein-disulfide reductase DsbD family protein [Rhodobacteraceae bacterium]|nr:protein-disulfide reductase DsbD family protein [Paracoccaceae bacterium]
MTRMFSIIGALLIAVSGAPWAQAQAMDDIVQLRVLDGGPTARGTHLAALHFTLAPGWKTYWRSPGDAGIPPLFDWSGSRNTRSVAVSWPAPRVFDQNGMTSVGYARQLVLPVEITAGDTSGAPHLRGTVDIGVCKDVCVPAHLRFDAALDRAAPRNAAITAALAQRPYSAAEAGVRRATCHLSPTQGGFRLEAHVDMPSAGGDEFTVIEPGNPLLWASEAVTEWRGGLLIAGVDLVHVDKAAFALDRSAVRITVLGRDHAVDIRGCAPK